MSLILDTAFLADFNNNDKKAIDLLYRNYHARLLLFCWHLLKQEQDAEDAVADIFIKLMQKKGIVKDVNGIMPYVFKVARNACIDKLKQKGNHKRRLQLYFFNVKKYVEMPIEYLSLEKLMSYKALEQTGAGLSEQQNKVFRMHLKGLSINEIAQKMELHNNTVSEHLDLARKKIVKRLKAYGYTINKGRR